MDSKYKDEEFDEDDDEIQDEEGESHETSQSSESILPKLFGKPATSKFRVFVIQDSQSSLLESNNTKIIPVPNHKGF
jgi:hypothetical protein